MKKKKLIKRINGLIIKINEDNERTLSNIEGIKRLGLSNETLGKRDMAKIEARKEIMEEIKLLIREDEE